jgi:uncharacterized protein (DUF4415 family)
MPMFAAIDTPERVEISVLLDSDIIQHYRDLGPDWRERMEAVLTRVALDHPAVLDTPAAAARPS